MNYRFLHCGTSTENYNICLEQKIVGFTNRGPQIGDLIYLAVNFNRKTFCGCRGIISEATDDKPWPDSDRYVNSFMLEKVEYSKAFDLIKVSKVGGQYFGLKYFMGARAILEKEAIDLLSKTFDENKINVPQLFPIVEWSPEKKTIEKELEIERENVEKYLKYDPDAKLAIMGTFQTINFKNEADPLRGLEVLVNENFYSLFSPYSTENTILIPENRKFLSSGTEAKGKNMISGIKSIPDALLILFNKSNNKCPLQINLIEYECFGENKTSLRDKSNYFNGQIIPQLMRFASSFSIVTDWQIREQTISGWTRKIVDYIFENNDHLTKVSDWIKILSPEIQEKKIGFKLNELLKDALKYNVKIVLVIDDLSTDQKDTIKNVINAFKLENGESTDFISYVIRLEQKINILNGEAEYALSVQ